MRFSRRWLADYIDLPTEINELIDVLSMRGLVVDDVETNGNDLVLDLDVPSNRPDAMNHFGVARELAAALDRSLHWPDRTLVESDTPVDSLATVAVDNAEDCPRFVARAIVGVRVGRSPAWLRERLEAIGARPVNNVVDVTNFVLWEMGHPLHAYDLDRLQQHRLWVRRATAGERLVTLDDIERRLDATDLVISDAEDPVGLAGVMGGANSAIEVGAQRVLLEGALFDARTVRRMARRHALHTDAGHRFERGMAFDGMIEAVDRAAALIAELTGGEVCLGRLDNAANAPPAATIRLRSERVRALLGIEIQPQSYRGVLENLGFEVRSHKGFDMVSVPYQRGDVRREVDLIEEIARHHGYDRLPGTVPSLRGAPTNTGSVELLAEGRLKSLCTALGFWETIALSFSNEVEQRQFLGSEVRLPRVTNPLSDATDCLRATLLPGLLAATARNRNHGQERILLFELGRCFTGGRKRIDECRHLALVASGPALPRHWTASSRQYDLSDLKGAMDTLADRMGWLRWRWEAASVPGLRAESAARLCGERGHGVAGVISSTVGEAVGIDGPVWIAEIEVEGALDNLPPPTIAHPLARFPASERDLSILLPIDVTYQTLASEILSLRSIPLDTIDLIDVYRGDDLPERHHSLTLRLRYRSDDRTLVGEEVDSAQETLTDHLQAQLGARVR